MQPNDKSTSPWMRLLNKLEIRQFVIFYLNKPWNAMQNIYKLQVNIYFFLSFIPNWKVLHKLAGFLQAETPYKVQRL